MAVLCGSAIVPIPSPSRANCPFFTRPAIERSEFTESHNSYVAGSYVCHQGTMFLCRTGGEWKQMGQCTSYQRWQESLSCKLEGTPAPECGQQPDRGKAQASPGTASTGGIGSAAAGGSARGNNAPGREQDSQRDAANANTQLGYGADPGAASLGAQSGRSPGENFARGGLSPGAPGSTNGFASPDGQGSTPYGTGTGGLPDRFAGAGSALGGNPNTGQGGQRGSPLGQDNRQGDCFAEEKRIEGEVKMMSARQQAAMNERPGFSYCQTADDMDFLAKRMQAFYARCPSADPTGEWMQYSRELVDWSRQIRSSMCKH